jgi:hypothetical protein
MRCGRGLLKGIILDKEIASQVNELMLEYSAKLDQSLKTVMDNCSAQEFKSYRDAVGQLMGIMLLDVMNPIYKQHPDLKPEQLL